MQIQKASRAVPSKFFRLLDLKKNIKILIIKFLRRYLRETAKKYFFSGPATKA